MPGAKRFLLNSCAPVRVSAYEQEIKSSGAFDIPSELLPHPRQRACEQEIKSSGAIDISSELLPSCSCERV
jgi:hypothetical protein